MPLEVLTREPARTTGKPPLLFVHGGWHAAWCWEEHFLPYFAEQGYPAHALSLRAHGGNGREGIRFARIDGYVADVAEVAGRMSRPPVLVGHSMGGLVVQRHLERSSAPAAVLLAPVPVGGTSGLSWRLLSRHPWIFLVANATWDPYTYVRTPELARELFFPADMPAGEVARHWGRLQQESYLAFMDMFALRLPRPHLVTRGGTPVLVLAAADDQIFTVEEEERTAAAYGTRAEIIPGMAHDMMLGAGWRTVADRVLGWLTERGL